MSQQKQNIASNVKSVTIRCRVSKEFDDTLEEYCKIHNVTKSYVMIEGIKAMLDAEKKEQKKQCFGRLGFSTLPPTMKVVV